MKNKYQLSALGVTAAALALLLGSHFNLDAKAQVTQPVNPQVPATQPSTNPNRPEAQLKDSTGVRPTDRRTGEEKAFKASELIGMNVLARTEDKNIGSIKDLMVTHEGRVSYAAVSFGGFLGIGDKMFAVPFEAIQFEKKGNDDAYARIDVSEESLKDRQGFDKDHWPQEPDKGFIGKNPQRQAANLNPPR